MLLTDCREEFLYDCQCRHLAKGTLRNYRAEINFLLEYLAAQDITDAAQVRPTHIRAFLKSKQDAGCKPAYINDLLKAHKCLFGYLADEGYIQADISKKVKGVHQPKVVIETFTEQEVRRLLGYYSGADFLSVRNKTVLALLFNTVARCNKIVLMQLENIANYIKADTSVRVHFVLSCSIMSLTSQSSIKQSVSNVFVVMGSPFFMRCRVFAERPSLKIK